MLVIFRDGQKCFDAINVQQQGDSQLMDNSQVIIPRSAFSCNGRLTGYLISLDKDDRRNNYPSIEVWRPVIATVSGEHRTTYVKLSEYILTESDITDVNDYYLGNVSYDINEAIQFQPGDVIGYYHPRRPRYTIWSIDTAGYSSFRVTTGMFGMGTYVTDILDTNNNRQPLIKVLYGMIT